jgi:FkbM family methyltransferase
LLDRVTLFEMVGAMTDISAARRALNRVGLNIHRYRAPQNPRFRLAALLGLHQIDTVLDVGANVGQYARSLREYGYDGDIISFEPMSREFNLLKAATAEDHRWAAYRYGLGVAEGEAIINVAGNSISSSMRPMAAAHSQAVPASVYVGEERIQVHRLDAVFDSVLRPGRRVFLKIDTQGFEREVLEGASGIVDRIAGIQLETSFVPLYEGQMLLAESLSLMASLGFILEGIEPGFVESTGRMYQMDLVCFRPISSTT